MTAQWPRIGLQVAETAVTRWLLGAVTHSHLDHVGAIEPLKEVYPELKVIVHETEAPFLIGGKEYSCYDYLPGGLSPGFKLLMWIRLLPPFYQYQVSDAAHRTGGGSGGVAGL